MHKSGLALDNPRSTGAAAAGLSCGLARTMSQIFVAGSVAHRIVGFTGKMGFHCQILDRAINNALRTPVLDRAKAQYKASMMLQGHTCIQTNAIGDLSLDEATRCVCLVANNGGDSHDSRQIRRWLLEKHKWSLGVFRSYGTLLRDLKECDLSRTQVSGNVEAVCSLAALEELDLSRTQVEGKVEALCSLSGLKKLYMYGTQVNGNIEALGSLTGLKKLFMYGTQVSGNIGALGSLTALEGLDLSRTHVSGNIEPLHSLTALKELYLSHTRTVSGNIEAVCSLTMLRRLDLSNTQVRGTIETLGPLTALQGLDLNSTKVRGNVEALCSLTGLEGLGLSHTHVRGNFEALCPLKSLKELYLSSSQLCRIEVTLRRLKMTLPNCRCWCDFGGGFHTPM